MPYSATTAYLDASFVGEFDLHPEMQVDLGWGYVDYKIHLRPDMEWWGYPLSFTKPVDLGHLGRGFTFLPLACVYCIFCKHPYRYSTKLFFYEDVQNIYFEAFVKKLAQSDIGNR